MTCDEFQDLIFLDVAGALEPGAERDALRAHLAAGCPVCLAALAEAEAMLAHADLATAEPVAPAPDLAGRLMSRVDARPARRNWRLPAAVALAAAASVAVTAAIFWALAGDAVRFWRSPDVAAVALADPGGSPAGGQVLWDREHGRWRVSVARLPAPPPGREYELWFIGADGKPIRSQTFGVDAQGRASVVVPVPAGLGPVATAAITDEPLGGSDAPTSEIRLAGKFE